MKLSDYAKQQGVRYETAWRWFRDGKIKGRRIGAHTILVEEEAEQNPPLPTRVAIYARVSSRENKSNLDSQAERLIAYCTAKGYQVSSVVKDAPLRWSTWQRMGQRTCWLISPASCTASVPVFTGNGGRNGRQRPLSRNWRPPMQLVEQHCIGKSDPGFASNDRVAFASKNLYNAALYEMRQAYIFRGERLCYEEVYHRMKTHEAYKALPAKVAQQVLKQLDKAWKGYFAACEA
jgi:hypothetical protein